MNSAVYMAPTIIPQLKFIPSISWGYKKYRFASGYKNAIGTMAKDAMMAVVES